MRKITKLMFALAMFAGGVTSANAQDEEEVEIVDLTKDMYHEWNGYEANASIVGDGKMDAYLIGDDTSVGTGATVYGDGSVEGKYYADLTGYTEMRITGSAGIAMRLLFNRPSMGGGSAAITELQNKVIGDDGTLNVSLLNIDDYPYVHLNVIKTGWAGTGTITSIKLVKPKDELGIYKDALKQVLSLARLQNSVAKTPESFAALTEAIAKAETALVASDASEESLTKAKEELDAAIKGLKLADGYTDLTQAMFKKYANHDNPGVGEGSGCAYALNTSSDLPYGDVNVVMNIFANLSGYDKLIVTMADGAPRFCFNRLTEQGQDDGSGNMIDIPNSATSADAYQIKDETGKVFTIDLEKMVNERGFAHLHSIKGAGSYGARVTVTGMYLYREATTVTLNKENGTDYCTFVSRYPTTWPVSGITAYKATVENGEVSFTEVESDVPSNTGLLLKAADAEYTINIPTTEPAGIENALVGVLKNTTIEKDGIFVLYKKDDNVGFYKTITEFTVGANTAYIPAQNVNAARTFIALPGGETTGVKAIEAAEADGKCYDLQGRQVSNPTKGLYISNGKKYVVK